MQKNKDPAKMTGTAPPQPEAENPVPRVYDCTGCRFVDSNGLVCGFCLRKILDGRAEQRKASLIAACFDGHNMSLLLGMQTVCV